VAYTVSYRQYNIKTNFGCTGAYSTNEYSATGVNLVDKVTLPDGRYYQFQYEPTPGFSGYYTGRPSSIKLPAGGTITYQYTGTNNGVSCIDSGASGLTRTVSDGTSSNTWTYSRTPSGSTSSTIVTAPSYDDGQHGSVQNDTVYTFLNGNPDSYNFYEIKRQTYAGSHTSGTLLQTILHCYESYYCSATSGDTNNYVPSPMPQNQTSVQWPDSTGRTSGTLNQYDSIGNLTSHAVYDYGTAGVYSTTPLQTTTISYWTNPSNQQETSKPSEITVKDSGRTILSDTKYSYGSTTVATSGTPQHTTPPNGNPGNLTSMQRWVSGTAWLTSNYTNFDTGNVQTATDVNGGQTTYTYGNCGNSYPTLVSTQTGGSTVPTLNTSASWNCSGGVPNWTQDVNTNQITYTYGSDPYWRPTSIQNDATTAVVNLSYPSTTSNSSGAAMSFNGVSSTSTSVTTYDGLGRTIVQQTLQGPAPSNYDTIATAYDSLGRVASTTLPYSGGAGNYVPSNPGSSFKYDTLGRTFTISDSGGGTVQYGYSSNDLQVTIGPQVTLPSTENLKKRNMEYNGAGWLTSVCEVVASTQPVGGACGQRAAFTGYETVYTYDGRGLLTQVQQNSQTGSSGIQTRLVYYDGLGRKTSETIPEWSAGAGVAGTSAYTYDSIATGDCSGSYAGDLLKVHDSVGNTTCYTYDLQHRPLSALVTASSPYSSRTPNAYFRYDAATYNGTTNMQNAKGKLAEAYTCSPSSCVSPYLTDEFFSASPVTSGSMAGGVQSQMWQSTPNSGGYFLTSDTYFPNGALGAISASRSGSSIGIPNFTFGVDGEGRPNTASDGTRNLVTGVTYNPASLALTATYGNASTGAANDVDSVSYDPNTFRPLNLTSSMSPTSGNFTVATVLTWNANGSLQRMQYTDGSPSPMNQDCKYSADDLRRIASVDCGSSAWGQNFSYDPFGNIQKSVPSGRTGTTYSTGGYSTVTNQALTGATYDKNGNQLTSTPATLTWNAWNVPVTVNSTSATYDALGRMVEKGVGSTYTQFVFRPSGAGLAVYSSGLSKGTVALPGGGTAVYNGSGLSYIRHKDWLGSSRLATTWAHAIYSKEAYAPFGETYNESGTPDRSFTAQDQNVATGPGGNGVYDFLFRKYDPSAGRWMSPDPAGWNAVNSKDPKSFNRYAYVKNNPLSLVDPTGLCDDWIITITWPGQAPVSSEEMIGDDCPSGDTYSISGGVFPGLGSDDGYSGYENMGVGGGGSSNENPYVKDACYNDVLLGSMIVGIGAALGIPDGAPGSDPLGDLVDTIRGAIENPGIQASIGTIAITITKILELPPVAERVAILLSEEAIPFVGWAATGYIAYKTISAASEYYMEHIERCQ